MYSSSSSEESETRHDPKVRAEHLDDTKSSELARGTISESSSGDTSSSEETAGAQSMDQSVGQSVVYVESEDDDDAGVSVILQMGCMDGFFMPGRAAAAKKSLIALNEKGEKELKFSMKMPIAMGFRNEGQKNGSENRDTDNQNGTASDGPRRTLRSVLNCRPDTPRNNNDIQEALDGFSVSSIRQQPTLDPPAKIAGEESSEQFKSIMSLSHDGSSGDDDSHFNAPPENLILPPPPPPPFHMHEQSQYVQHGMMQGPPPMHHPAGWHQQNMFHPQHPPVTVNNTYEMLVVNGMMPQHQHIYGYGTQQNYWNYTHNQTLPHHHRPLEPPAIEKPPSQILVQKEDQTIGEDSSCLSYEHVLISSPSSSAMQYLREQQRQEFGARTSQNNRQQQTVSAHYRGQSVPMQNTRPLKAAHQKRPQRTSPANDLSRIPAALSSRTEDSAIHGESDDDFQDSVQVLPEDQIAGSLPRPDVRSCSTTSSEENKPPRVQRWRQANLRRLKGPALSSKSKPAVVSTISSTGSKSSIPSFDEAPVRQTNQEGKNLASFPDEKVAERNDDEIDDDDDETIDSEMATVDTEQMYQAAKKKKASPDPKRLQPVQEEDTSTSIEGVPTDSEAAESEASSSSESLASASVASGSTTLEGKNLDIRLPEVPSIKLPAEPVTEINDALEPLAASESKNSKEDTDSGSFLMFDSIYTRRRERRDAAKMKMNKFLESKKTENKTTHEAEKQAAMRATTRLSRLNRMMNLSRSSTKESENTSPTSQESVKVSSKKDLCLVATPQRENKTLPPPIETAGRTDAVLQPILDVPGFNSPGKRMIRGSGSPSKQVSMIPLAPMDSAENNMKTMLDIPVLSSPVKRSTHGPESPSKRDSMSPSARTASADRNLAGIKYSWSLKPSMTSEFQDALSRASSNDSCASSAFGRGREPSSSNSRFLQLQPTMSSEWHDAVDTPSPKFVSVASAANKKQHLERTLTEESLPGTEPPSLNTSRIRMISGCSSRNSIGKSNASRSLSDEEDTSVNSVSSKLRSSDHDEYFEATCVVE
jgi:hypothetical protein